ncbi:hypothetical protein HOY80DRAFT_1028745 [Tuber brumale]|nr:hypothetical protein HOY80DRAFT_1028745 [Tuber brumale]
MRHIINTFSALTHEASTILHTLKTLSRQHAPNYTSIVREFSAIERGQTRHGRGFVGWTTAREQGVTRVGLREGLKGPGRVSGGEPVLLEAQVRAARGMVELRRTRNARMSARSPGLGGIGKRGSGAGAGVVMGYQGVFTPTKAKII